MLENHPQLKREDITAVLKYAAEVLKGKNLSSFMSMLLADGNIPVETVST
ncbi:MAG: hypothetical protein N3F08_03065 [Crenarchaeota archaeon]|nr:hypothetical protein [Thermoproteota archaeon]